MTLKFPQENTQGQPEDKATPKLKKILSILLSPFA